MIFGLRHFVLGLRDLRELRGMAFWGEREKYTEKKLNIKSKYLAGIRDRTLEVREVDITL